MTATSATATRTQALSSTEGWVSSYTNPQDPSDISSPAYIDYRRAELIAITAGTSLTIMSLNLLIQEYTRSHYSFMPQATSDASAKEKLARAYQIDPRKVQVLQRLGLRVHAQGFLAFNYFQDCVATLGNTYIIAKTPKVSAAQIEVELGDRSSSDLQSKKIHQMESIPTYVALLNEHTGVYLTPTSFVRIHLGEKAPTTSYSLSSAWGLLNSQKDRLYTATKTACASYDLHSDAFENRANFGALSDGHRVNFLLTDGDMVITLQRHALKKSLVDYETVLTTFQVGKRDRGEDEMVEVSRFSLSMGVEFFYLAHVVDIGEIALSTEWDYEKLKGGSILRFGPPVSQNIHVERSTIPVEIAPKAPALVTQELLNLIDGLIKNEAVKKDSSLLQALQNKRAEIENDYPNRDLSNENALFFNLARNLLEAKGAIKQDIREELLKKE